MPEDRLSNDEDGRRQYAESQFIDALKQSDTPTTTDVAEYVGCSPQAALYRLDKMENERTVSSTKIGNAKVWRISGQSSNTE